MKSIPLTQGKFALVDDSDFDRLNAFRWFVNRMGRRWYAARRSSKVGGGTGRLIPLHREIAGVPGMDVDHINGDGLDNRRENLRPATRSQNLSAFCLLRAGKTSRYRGVSWQRRTRKWVAQITFAYLNYHLGRFSSEEDAARAYDATARKFFGEFASPNFP